MPSISRFRIVNFRYDNDKKYISNELFLFNGQSGLLNLENGGGKSVILQLALQVLLPNTDLSSRKFVDYFKVNSGTVHVMIEWLLDSITTEYLLTGICASRDSEGLKYFTYIHSYESPNECDIANIQVVNSKKQVTGYSDLYKYLRSKTTEYRINTYSRDRVRDYKEKLYTYNLFDVEFEAVKTINQSEGGIEKFFERARKSRNVIEKLIIPAIPAIGGDTENLLADTFKKHLNNLKSIPLLQHNIKVYDQFCERAGELILKLEDYSILVDEHTSMRQQLVSLENLVRIVLSRIEGDIERNENDRNEIKQQIRSQKFKWESWQTGKIALEKGRMEEGREAVQSGLNADKVRVEVLEKENDYRTAINYCMDLRDSRKKLLELKARLDTLSLEKGEMELQYQNQLLHLQQLLTGECEKLETALIELRKIKEALEAENTADENARNEVGSRKQAVISEIAVVKDNIARLEAQLKDCSTHLSWDLTLLLDPSRSLDKLNGDLSDNVKKVQESEHVSKEAASKLEDSRKSLLSLDGVEALLTQKKAGLGDEIHTYDHKLQELIKEISMYGIEGDPYYGNLEEKLDDMAAKSSSALAVVQNRIYNLEGKKLLLDGLDYYIPDNEIKLVDSLLKEAGVHCMPGALWLKNQDKPRREELLRLNPMLPYSVVVVSTEIKKVWELTPEILKRVEQFPVAIISDSGEGISLAGAPNAEDARAVESAAGADAIGGRQVYILNASNNRMVLDESEFSAFVENIGTNLSRSNEESDALKKDQQALYGLTGRLAEFIKSYGPGYRAELQTKAAKLEKEIEACKSERVKRINERDAAEKLVNETVELLSKLAEEKEWLKDNIHFMESYIKTSTEVKEYRNSLDRLDPVLKRLEAETALLEQKRKSTAKEIKLTGDRTGETERERNKHRDRLLKIQAGLSIKEFTMTVEGGLEETDARVAALEVKIGHGDIEAVRFSLQTMENACRISSGEIRKSGFDEKDFEGVFERTPEEAIQEEEAGIKLLRKQIKASEADYNKLESDISKLAGKLEVMNANILKEYGEEPCRFDDIRDLDEKDFNDRIRELESKQNKLSTRAKSIQKRKEDLNSNLNNISSFITYRNITLPQELRGEMLELNVNGEKITLWDMMKMEPESLAVIVNRYKTGYDDNTNRLNKGKEAVKLNFDKLYSNDEWENNSTVRQVLSNLMDDNLYNIDYVRAMFDNLFTGIENLKQAALLQLEECRRNKDEIVERCYIRALAVYDEVRMVDTFSRIKIRNENVKTIKIEMPKIEEERGKAMMSLYLEACIDEIEKMKEDGTYDPVKIDDTMLAMMSPVKLLDAVVSLNDIFIKVFKPEHNMELSGYIPWEVVIQWSGGEKLAGFFAMFISIISYLRYKRTGWQGSTKVIWIDNPFGQANAGHLLEYIFELAKATKTQMICLTGLQEVNIYAQFDVVYSLVHRMLSNMSIIQSRAVKTSPGIESAYYMVSQEQMSMFTMLDD